MKKLYKAFCGFRGVCVKSDKLPFLMSLVEAEDNCKKNWGCGVRGK